MIEINKEDLQDYIRMRRNAINELLKFGIVPGTQDSIDIYNMRAVLKEFKTMEEWFSE